MFVGPSALAFGMFPWAASGSFLRGLALALLFLFEDAGCLRGVDTLPRGVVVFRGVWVFRDDCRVGDD